MQRQTNLAHLRYESFCCFDFSRCAWKIEVNRHPRERKREILFDYRRAERIAQQVTRFIDGETIFERLEIVDPRTKCNSDPYLGHSEMLNLTSHTNINFRIKSILLSLNRGLLKSRTILIVYLLKYWIFVTRESRYMFLPRTTITSTKGERERETSNWSEIEKKNTWKIDGELNFSRRYKFTVISTQSIIISPF